MDILFVNSTSSAKAYQSLAEVYSAIEPPTWALLLAESCRKKGADVAILDCDAERLSLDQSVKRIAEIKPRMAVFAIYGQNPNSGTINMIGALALANAIKEGIDYDLKIIFVGSHVSALPLEVLANNCVDIVLLNEGVYALHELLKSDLRNDLNSIKGIGYKKKEIDGSCSPSLNPPQIIVPQERMDEDLPGYAWDLLPYRQKPLDLYRAHFWHADFNQEKRTPFAAIYTSLGCPFGCDFCMINILNRVDNSEHINSSHSKGIRFWSKDWVIREMKKLANLGVKTLRISDELFIVNKNRYIPMLESIIDHDFDFNMWSYSRIDTIKNDTLDLLKRAGINWLALGIEAGNQLVRQEVSKGTFKSTNIRSVRKMIGDADINIIGNYIFGFPDDTLETMQQTLDLALELNTEMANMYPCQALPGSPIYNTAKKNNWKLPESYEGYAFLSYECEPLPTKYLTSAEVLRFRDQAWQKYFTNPAYLSLVERKFGKKERENVEAMASIKLRRKILDPSFI
jgi:anaerobic magnesium-protoporphyrin IX monomethyl ester cyclase